MASDIDERWLELHQRVDAVVETADVASLEWWYEFETGNIFFRYFGITGYRDYELLFAMYFDSNCSPSAMLMPRR